MAIIKLKITEDMIKLISNIHFGPVPVLEDENPVVKVGLDYFSLYGTDLTFENIAYLIGRYEEHIPGTEENPLGAEFPKELEDYMWELHGTILENIQNIEEIVHQFAGRGGISPGVYKCRDYEHIWEKEK